MLKRKLFILSAVYFVQGIPYGFMDTPLPTYLRQSGMSLTRITLLASVMSLPWLFKILWGPLVDRFTNGPFGRRRSWILPLQTSLVLCCLAGAFVPGNALKVLIFTVFLMNLFAATMDVAVDGLAVDLLTPEELGYGNIAQVVGYKVGALTGGGLLMTYGPRLGQQGQFLVMAALATVTLGITLTFREPIKTATTTDSVGTTTPSIGEVLSSIVRALRVPGAAGLLIFIATYKLGETLADAIFKPFLVDSGYTTEQIGFWVGTWGLLISLTGSILGGVLASRIGLLRALACTATLRAIAVGGEWWLSLVEPTVIRMACVVTAEQFFGGALTTAMFAYMMSKVDRRIGATHFTLLASVEVFGKLAARSVAGKIADETSASLLFGLATLISVLFLLLLIPLFHNERSHQAKKRQHDPN